MTSPTSKFATSLSQAMRCCSLKDTHCLRIGSERSQRAALAQGHGSATLFGVFRLVRVLGSIDTEVGSDVIINKKETCLQTFGDGGRGGGTSKESTVFAEGFGTHLRVHANHMRVRKECPVLSFRCAALRTQRFLTRVTHDRWRELTKHMKRLFLHKGILTASRSRRPPHPKGKLFG